MYKKWGFCGGVVHLLAAAAILPDDPRVLFDRAMYPGNPRTAQEPGTVADHRPDYPAPVASRRGTPAAQPVRPRARRCSTSRRKRGEHQRRAPVPPDAESRSGVSRRRAFAWAVLIERNRHDEALAELRGRARRPARAEWWRFREPLRRTRGTGPRKARRGPRALTGRLRGCFLPRSRRCWLSASFRCSAPTSRMRSPRSTGFPKSRRSRSSATIPGGGITSAPAGTGRRCSRRSGNRSRAR